MICEPMRAELESLKAIYLGEAKSQILQDVFVLSLLGPEPGYFVEFGAASGVEFSNTYLFEKRFGWRGVLAEPGRNWHASIEVSRAATLDRRCVWRRTGERLTFCEHPDGNLSAVEDHASASAREVSSSYQVETVSLGDLLDGVGAPEVVDYLSADTEGAELDILGAYDFRRMFRVVTVEHNHDACRRAAVYEIMVGRGYCRVCEDLSDFDDWYVHPELVGGRRGG